MIVSLRDTGIYINLTTRHVNRIIGCTKIKINKRVKKIFLIFRSIYCFYSLLHLKKVYSIIPGKKTAFPNPVKIFSYKNSFIKKKLQGKKYSLNLRVFTTSFSGFCHNTRLVCCRMQQVFHSRNVNVTLNNSNINNNNNNNINNDNNTHRMTVLAILMN